SLFHASRPWFAGLLKPVYRSSLRGPDKDPRSFNKAFSTACRKAGCPGRYLHDFRRTAVRNLERAGVPRSVAMKLTGHKTESVYRRYAIVPKQDLVDGLKRLAEYRTALEMKPDDLRVVEICEASK